MKPQAEPAPAPVPEDLDFPSSFQPCDLSQQIAAARAEVQRYRQANYHRTHNVRGQFSMHENTYSKALHQRRSVLYTLIQLQRRQQTPA